MNSTFCYPTVIRYTQNTTDCYVICMCYVGIFAGEFGKAFQVIDSPAICERGAVR